MKKIFKATIFLGLLLPIQPISAGQTLKEYKKSIALGVLTGVIAQAGYKLFKKQTALPGTKDLSLTEKTEVPSKEEIEKPLSTRLFESLCSYELCNETLEILSSKDITKEIINKKACKEDILKGYNPHLINSCHSTQAPIHFALDLLENLEIEESEKSEKIVQIIKKLLELGADANCVITPDRGIKPDNMTPLIRLMFMRNRFDKSDLVKALIQAGANVNATTSGDYTPLHFAASKKDTPHEVIAMLIDNGADMDALNRDGRTPLQGGAFFQSKSVITLIEKGADIKKLSSNLSNILHFAVWGSDNNPDLAFLLKQDLDINAQNAQGETPLHTAASRNYIISVRQLCEAGANINARNNEGQTPLHIAVVQSRHEAVVQLCEAGADQAIRDNDGNTAFHRSLRSRDWNLTSQYLLDNGADINARNNNGQTPLHNAASSNAYEAVVKLCEAGANPTIADNNRNTPAATVDPARTNAQQILDYLNLRETGYPRYIDNPIENSENNLSYLQQGYLKRAYLAAAPIEVTINNNTYLLDLFTIYKNYSENGKIDKLKEVLKKCEFNKLSGEQKTALLKLGAPLKKSELHTQSNLLNKIETQEPSFEDVIVYTQNNQWQ